MELSLLKLQGLQSFIGRDNQLSNTANQKEAFDYGKTRDKTLGLEGVNG